MQLGTIEGEVDTSSFEFRATEEVRKFDFVSVKSNDKWILAQVEEVTKHPDGETIAKANIIGYREKGLTKAPRRVIEPDSIVYQADQELISDTLGLKDKGLQIGNLQTNDEIDIHVNAEQFYKHFAVLAQTGAGKCVTPRTNVLMSDGSTAPIKEVFDGSDQVIKEDENEELRILNDCSVKALDDSYSFTDADAIYAYRKKADKILNVKTASGREIEVTPEHPLMVAEEDYSFVDSEEMEEGQHIAVPREISTATNESLELSEDLRFKADQESRRRKNLQKQYDKYRALEEEGKPISEMEVELDVSRSTIENWKYQDYVPDEDSGLALSTNSKGIQVPERLSPELAEFLSLVIAEGTEQQAEGSYRIIFTNEDRRLLQRFRTLSDELFELETRSIRENADYIDSTSLKHLLEDIGYGTLQRSKTKEIPDMVMRSSEKSKRKFLRTFYDCEGCMEDHEITLASASKEVVDSLSYMLLEFGIVSRISYREKRATNSDHEGDTYYRLCISGVDQMQKFAEEIGFGIERKQEKLENYLEDREGNTNADVVPVKGDYLKKERNKVGFSQRELAEKIDSHSTLISLYERDERRPSREKFSAMADELDRQLFNDLASSDIYWDKIVSIEEKEYSGYVYDLTVREHHNFVAGTGGIVSHNSYLTGVLIEELLEQDFPVMIMDPHGEFSSLRHSNPENGDPEARGYDVKEYSPNTDINSDAMPLQFSSKNLGKKELMTLIPDNLTNSQMGVLYNALKRLKEKDEDYTLLDIEDAVSQEDSTAKWNLLNYLEQLEESGLFDPNPVDLKDLLEPGTATVVNLKAVEPDAAEMTAYMLAKKLFDLRKKDMVPPFLMVMEEAHNFVPEQGFGKAVSNDILRKIASEGRKFGLGLGVISQRPARIDKNVLSQCNTQFILRVTNPNDLKAISKSFEGITSEVEDMIKSLPPGVSFVLGNDYPVMTDVRQRKSQHGGETQTSETYVEKESIDVFKPQRSLNEVKQELGNSISEAWYPLYLVENSEKKILVDGVKDQVKAEKAKVKGQEKKVLNLVAEGRSKSEIVDETGLQVSKIASKLQELRDKGLIDEDQDLQDSIFDLGIEEEVVEVETLIEYEISGEEAAGRLEDASVSRVYYPYFSDDETVYDPVLEKEVG
jgi:DNA helicase HerA-like ATPase/transcriptional regulator with XRE-family HTH domain